MSPNSSCGIVDVSGGVKVESTDLATAGVSALLQDVTTVVVNAMVSNLKYLDLQ